MLEVFTVGGGDYLVNTFNAIAAWTGSGGFKSLIGVCMVMGLIYALLITAMDLDWRAWFRWFIQSTLIYLVLMVPTVTIKVTDRINPSATLTLGDTTGGGSFSLLTPASGAHLQTLDSVTIAAGSNSVSAIATPGTTTTLFASTQMSDDLAYTVVKIICENAETLRNAHKALSDFDCEKAGVWRNEVNGLPLHAGAERYYRERGWLN